MTQTDQKSNEFTLIYLNLLIIILRREYKIILSFTFIFLIIGIFYFLNIPKEYIASCKILPEVSYKPSDGMAGINQVLKKYNSNIDLYNTEITSPELYSEILKTTDFYQYILNKKVRTKNNNEISFKSYCDYNLEKKNIFFEKEKTHSITNINEIQKRILITTNKKNNLILVSVNMPDPSVAVDVANFTTVYFLNYIIKYRTKKARNKLHFIENLQKSFSTDSIKKEELAKEIQNSLSVLTVQMKIQIQEDTPIFQILEKAQSPVSSTEASVLEIISGFIFSGFLIGIIIAFLRNNNYKMLLNSN